MNPTYQKKASIENRSLLVGGVANLVMALLAWSTYYYSNSEAILLDGNYSFIMFIGVMIALKISVIKAKRTKIFPLGQFFYESLYSFIKGLMILGVLIMAVATAVIRIITYIGGDSDNIPILIPDPILYYALICAVICYSVSYFYKRKNAKLGNQSILLKTEQKATFVDGTLSLGIAAGIFLITRSGGGSDGGFIAYLADSIFVLILASFLINEPITIIKNAVIELAGGTLQDEKQRTYFETIIHKNIVKPLDIEGLFISKNGSKYIIIIYVTSKTQNYPSSSLNTMKSSIIEALKNDYPYVTLDIIPEGSID